MPAESSGNPGDNPGSRQPTPAATRFIDVSAALIVRDGQLLIARRHAHSHLGGYWEFPGGKREAGETFEACLAREIREELGVEISVGGLFEEVFHDYPGKSIHLRFFWCALLSGEPQPLDCAAVQWVSPADLGQFAFPAADAQLIEKLKRARI